MDKKSTIIGFCGGLGSGKSTLANKIKEELKDQATIVYMDDFCKYRELAGDPKDDFIPNEPDEFNIDLMVRCVSELAAGNDTFFPVYGFSTHKKEERPWVSVKSTPVIILDGELLFAIPEIRNLIDIKVFVDTDPDVRITRRIHAEIVSGENDVESLIERFILEDKPTDSIYIQPYKKYADVIIPEGGLNSLACEMLVGLLKNRISGN